MSLEIENSRRKDESRQVCMDLKRALKEIHFVIYSDKKLLDSNILYR